MSNFRLIDTWLPEKHLARFVVEVIVPRGSGPEPLAQRRTGRRRSARGLARPELAEAGTVCIVGGGATEEGSASDIGQTTVLSSSL